MDIRWKTLFAKTVTWLAAEVVLNAMGLDTIADYSEFLWDLAAPWKERNRNPISYLNSNFNPHVIDNKFERFLPYNSLLSK